MGLSKQMVSRIFTEMGYKPIRGTRKTQITQKNVPILNKIMQDDCNARLKEMSDEIRKVKSEAASARQYQNKVILELRCKLVKYMTPQITEEDEAEYKEYRHLCKVIRTVRDQLLQTMGAIPPAYSCISEVEAIIEGVK
jgi:hypothetical protein